MNESAPNDEGRTKRKALSAHRAATRRQKSERQFARTRDNRIRALKRHIERGGANDQMAQDKLRRLTSAGAGLRFRTRGRGPKTRQAPKQTLKTSANLNSTMWRRIALEAELHARDAADAAYRAQQAPAVAGA